MPRKKRSVTPRAGVKQPVTKKVSKSPLGLFDIETHRLIPVTSGVDKCNGALCIGSFQLCFQESRVVLANQEEYGEGDFVPCMNRALVVLEDDSIWLACWKDYTLQLLSIKDGLSRELMWALSTLHYKGLTLHPGEATGLIMEMFPCSLVPGNDYITINVVVQGDLLICSDPCEVPRLNFKERLPQIRELMLWLHPSAEWLTDPVIDNSDISWNVALVIDDFYRHTKQQMRTNTFDWYNLSVKGVGDGVAEKMCCVLRPYQWRAVGWMLAREGAIVCDTTVTKIMDELANIWSKLSGVSGDNEVYYNNYTGRFCSQLLSSDQTTISGGILADEMGLGKTVEVLALILSNQWMGYDKSVVEQLQQQVQPLEGAGLESNASSSTGHPIFTPPTFIKREQSDDNENKPHIIACVCGAMTTNNYVGEWVSCDNCDLWYHATCVKFDRNEQQDFFCVRCLYTPDNPVVCGSTLIVSPVSIANQWLSEIEKHIKPGILKVLHYRGIKLDGYITPPEMASYDIVLTTYEVLKTEVYFSDNLKEFNRVLRHPKKYIPPRTPLCLLHWWRICLDEAQMIEGKYTNAARMVQQLSAAHRWCVTGTPLQQGVYDLYGLLFFLRLEPYVCEGWWKTLLWKPFAEEGNWAPMLRACSKLFWRNSKLDVAEELQLPPHSECVHWLNFSPVERHFYRKTLEKCSHEFEIGIQRHCDDDQALRNLDNHTVSKVLAPLRKLRLACCHPQLVKNGYLVGSRGHVTMAKLLEQLTRRAQNEVMEALRMLVSACNGIAAIYQIKHQWQEAVDMYRHIIKTWEEYSNDAINVDRLQKIHTLENLADLLDADHSLISDDSSCSVNADQQLVNSDQHFSNADQHSNNANQCSCDTDQNYSNSDQHSSNAEHSSNNADQSSGNADQSSSNADQNSSNADKSSSNADQSTNNADQSSNNADKSFNNADHSSSSADQGFCNADQSSSNANQTSNNADQSASNADQTSSNADQSSKNADQSSSNMDQRSSNADEYSSSRKPLRDKDLRSEVKKLRDEYLKNHNNALSTAANGFHSVHNQCMDTKNQFDNMYDPDHWWDKVLDWSRDADISDKLMEAVTMEINTIPSHAQVVVRTPAGLQYLIMEEVDKLVESREEVLEWVRNIMVPPSGDEVRHAAACHLRTGKHSLPLFLSCQYCDAEVAIQELHNLLYMKMTYNSGEEYSSRADGFVERLLKSINTFVRYHGGPQHIISEAKDHFALLEEFKKEIKAIKEVWLASHGLVAALDELEMSTTKLQLMRCHRNNDPGVHLLETHEVEPTLFQLRLEKNEAEQELKKVLGQLLYLNNLNKVSDIKGENTDPCPICVKTLGSEWAVMTCGHCLCTDCCDQLLQHHRYPHPYSKAGRIQCPLCREMCHADEIGAVSTNPNSMEVKELKIEGSYSTKIEGVIMAVLSIRKDHPEVKMIVFSMWSESLELVAHGLKQNGVQFLHGKDQKSLQKSLHQFKEDEDIKVLLLPTHSGSKGLNLTEASHVILCEPTLNMADEHQAIGRVYRMGQTRPTVVHRLYIKDSVEEKIRTLIPTHVSSDVQKKVYHDLTVEHVRELLAT